MALIVQKFGGTSVANIERIRNVARLVKKEVDAGNQVVVVLSAMSGVTNRLVAYCQEITPVYDPSEYDAVVSTGEQVTVGLLAILLKSRGLPARSWAGWQVPVETDNAHGKARITRIGTEKLRRALAEGVISRGRGFSWDRRGRPDLHPGAGRGDTSAVALAAVLKAAPLLHLHRRGRRLHHRSPHRSKAASCRASPTGNAGNGVARRQGPADPFGRDGDEKYGSTFKCCPASRTFPEPGCDEKTSWKGNVSGIPYSRDERPRSPLQSVKDRPGVAAAIFGPLADANINVDMIVQDVSDRGHTDITFTVPRTTCPGAQRA